VWLRIKHGLVLLLALLVVGASSQAAVCELSCAARMQAGACHEAASVRQAASSQMSADCMTAMSAHKQGLSVEGGHDGSCNHPAAVAFEKGPSSERELHDVAWVVVDVLPVRMASTGRVGTAGENRRLRPVVSTPRLVSLRI
jgi:hypothetical protein